MLIPIILVSIWLLLMLQSGLAEYRYYQSVKTLEPELWGKLGSPKFLKIPVVFISPKGAKLLKGATDKTVCVLASRHRQAGIQFLTYVVLVLVGCIVYFKTA
jgi:hypothetical protein